MAFKRVRSSVACCALSTRVGTRDEQKQLNGLAHFTEHMFFKGTRKRGAQSINNVLERVGGELNAYTTKEDTVLHATVLKEDISKAIDLLLELAFTSVFPPKEIEKEREVIYDEIVSYKDSPAETIYDEFEFLLFNGHPLSMPILGDKKSLKKIGQEAFLKYIEDNFVPDNMSFALVADMLPHNAIKIIEKSLKRYCNREVEVVLVEEETKGGSTSCANATNSFTHINCSTSSITNSGSSNEVIDFVEPFNKEITKKNYQAQCIVGTTAYSCYNKKRVALAVLTNILGGPASNSRLNLVLREKHALVYNVEAAYTTYADTGIFSIYFGCDKADVERCIAYVKAELERVVDNLITPAALKAAKKQLIGQLTIAKDNSEAQCLSLGKSLMVHGAIESFGKTRERIESITAEQLQEVAQKVLRWERMSTLVYL